MKLDVYCDESHPDLFASANPKSRFMVIGSLWLPTDSREDCKKAIHTLRDRHKIGGGFFHWQNHEHHHWGLGLLTPATVHFGHADTVLAARQAVLTAAHAIHPERFVRHPPRPLPLPSEVWINPPADGPEPRVLQLPRDTNFVPQLSQRR